MTTFGNSTRASSGSVVAWPKSPSFTTPSEVINTFSGLMSCPHGGRMRTIVGHCVGVNLTLQETHPMHEPHAVAVC